MFPHHPQTYTLIIDHDQYKLLVTALALAATPATDDMNELFDLLREVPTREKEEPGVIHGLCY